MCWPAAHLTCNQAPQRVTLRATSRSAFLRRRTVETMSTAASHLVFFQEPLDCGTSTSQAATSCHTPAQVNTSHAAKVVPLLAKEVLITCSLPGACLPLTLSRSTEDKPTKPNKKVISLQATPWISCLITNDCCSIEFQDTARQFASCYRSNRFETSILSSWPRHAVGAQLRAWFQKSRSPGYSDA